jgi:hypothetical protein
VVDSKDTSGGIVECCTGYLLYCVRCAGNVIIIILIEHRSSPTPDFLSLCPELSHDIFFAYR